MIITDWVSFMVLDIGNEVIEAIPIGTRLAIGLLQASAVRAAGFATISISTPAVKRVTGFAARDSGVLNILLW